MSFQAKDVFDRVRIHLNDQASTRWPLTELAKHINAGLREITVVAPRAVSDIVVLDLAAGALQTLPDTCTRVLRANANVTSLLVSRQRLSVVKAVTRAQMDAVQPGWENPLIFPATDECIHYVEDPNMNGEFLVWPPNTGAGFLEVVAAKRPTLIGEAGSDTDLSGWTAQIDLDDRYFTALVDYVMFSALMKDIAVPANAARAQAHYAAFRDKVGVGPQNEAAGSATAGTTE